MLSWLIVLVIKGGLRLGELGMRIALLMLRGIEPVVGAYGPLDGLVLNQLMVVAYTALTYRLGLTQWPL